MDVGLGKNNMKLSQTKQFKMLVKNICPICGEKMRYHADDLCFQIKQLKDKEKKEEEDKLKNNKNIYDKV